MCERAFVGNSKRERRRLGAAVAREEPALRRAVARLHRDFGDILTHRGRPYLTKMAHDRSEMLYALEVERLREQGIVLG